MEKQDFSMYGLKYDCQEIPSIYVNSVSDLLYNLKLRGIKFLGTNNLH